MIVIDSDDYKKAGIETMFFPGGEPHAKLPVFDDSVLFYLRPRSWADIGFGALVLNSLLGQLDWDRVDLFMPYIPGARQDKGQGGRAPLTIKTIADMFPQVRVTGFDVHSFVTPYTFGPRFKNLMPKNLDNLVMTYDGIIAPDYGALQRARSFQKTFCPAAEIVHATKSRDPKTGALSNYVLPPLKIPGNYLVVDDICDGGATFNLLAECFQKDPLAKECTLHLWVSHGIFSRGLDNLNSIYTRIFTTDSWCKLAENQRLKIVPLLPQLLDYWS